MRTVHTSMTGIFPFEFYCISLNDNIGTFDFSIFPSLFDVPLNLHATPTEEEKHAAYFFFFTKYSVTLICNQLKHRRPI